MSYNSKFPDEYDEYGEYSPDRNTQGDIRFDDDVIDLFNFDQARKRRQQKLREAQAEQSRREDAAENDGYADSPEAENVRRAVTERSRKMQSGRYDRRLNDRYDGGEYDSYDDEYDRHDHREYDRGDDIAYGELLESRFGEPSPRRRSRQDITFSEHPVRKAEERRNRPAAKKSAPE